jgi:hypothetical protein
MAEPRNSSSLSRSDASSAQGIPSASRSVPSRMHSLSTIFLVLSHERDCPLRYRLPTRFETMPTSKFGGGLEELGAIAIDMVAELDRRAGIRLDELA